MGPIYAGIIDQQMQHESNGGYDERIAQHAVMHAPHGGDADARQAPGLHRPCVLVSLHDRAPDEPEQRLVATRRVRVAPSPHVSVVRVNVLCLFILVLLLLLIIF